MRLAEWTAPARARVSTTKYVVLIGSQLRAGRPITRRGSRSRKIKTSKRRRERERRKKKRNRNATADWFLFFFKHQRGNQSAHGRNCGPHQIIDGFLLINDGHGSNGRLNEFVFSPFLLLFTVFASDRKKWNHQKKQQEIRPQNKRPSLLLLLLLFLLLFLLFFYGFLLLLPTKN